MSNIVFSPFQRNNGEHASKGPCRPGFSQSFYSVLISRDVLRGQAILKGETFNWPVTFFSFFFLHIVKRIYSVSVRAPAPPFASLWPARGNVRWRFPSMSRHVVFTLIAFAHMEKGCETNHGTRSVVTQCCGVNSLICCVWCYNSSRGGKLLLWRLRG